MRHPAPYTVAIPAPSEPATWDQLARTLSSLEAERDFPAEILVVGDSAPPEAERHAPQVRFLQSASADPVSLRQAALAAAAERWFAVLEPGTVLLPGALALVAAGIRSHRDAAVVYTDEIAGDSDEPVLKPVWSPRLLLEGNYLGRLCLLRTDAARAAGGFVPDDVVTGGYDLLLRLVDRGAGVSHLPVIAVSTRESWPPTAGSEAAVAAARCAGRSLVRRGVDGHVEPGAQWNRVRRSGPKPDVAVVIPTRDRVDLLRRCIGSVETNTSYPNVELVVVDNGSVERHSLDYLRALEHRVLPHPGPFNFSAIVNAAVAATTAPFVLLLNNDTEMENRDWLDVMVEEALDPSVGAVGCRLVGEDGHTQHEGIALGLDGAPALNLDLGGYCNLDRAVRDVAAVTAACVLVPRSAFDAVGGFDPALAVGYGDVDFCLRLREAGYRILYTPHAVVRHLAQATRGKTPHPDDDDLFAARWPLHRAREVDPFVNPRIDGFAPLRLAASGVAPATARHGRCHTDA